MPSSSWILRAVFGPRPGIRVSSTSAGGELLLQLRGRRDLARLEQRLDLLRDRLADALELGQASLLGELLDRERRLAHRPRRLAVGDDPVDDRAVELVQVGRARRAPRRSPRSVMPLAYDTRPDGPMRRWPPGPVWVIVPTYNERENLEPLVAAVAPRSTAARPSTRSWSSTTTRPTAPGELADRLARARPARARCCTRPEKRGLGRAYIAGFRRALDAGRRAGDRDGRRLLPRSRATCPRLIEAAARGRPRARLPLRAGGEVRNWGPVRRLVSRGGLLVRARGARRRRAGPDRRLQVLPARGARGDRPRRRCAPRATPSRSS